MRRSWAARRTRKLSLPMWPFRFHLILRILGVQKRPPKRAKFLKRPPILPFPFPRKTGSPKRWPYLPNRRPKKAKKRARTSRRDPLHHPISLKNQWVFDVFKNKRKTFYGLHLQPSGSPETQKGRIWVPRRVPGGPNFRRHFFKNGSRTGVRKQTFSGLDRNRPQASKQAKSDRLHSLLPGHLALGGDYRGVD